MAERKPPEMGFETWIDKQIREAQERGEFDDLPLTGKPLPTRGPSDEYTWIREKLAREGESTDALLPTPLRLRKEIHRLPETLRDVRSEQQVRAVVGELNEQVKRWLLAPSGPNIPVGPVDADTVVAGWRAARAERAEAERQVAEKRATAAAEARAVADQERSRVSWWRRLGGRRAGRTR